MGWNVDRFPASSADPIQVSAGTVAVLAGSGGNLQTSVAGTPVPVPPTVLVTDAAANPIAGIPIIFAADRGRQTAAVGGDVPIAPSVKLTDAITGTASAAALAPFDPGRFRW